MRQFLACLNLKILNIHKCTRIDVHKEPEISDYSDEDHALFLHANKLSKTVNYRFVVKEPEICDLTEKDRPLDFGSKHLSQPRASVLKKSSIRDNNKCKHSTLHHARKS